MASKIQTSQEMDRDHKEDLKTMKEEEPQQHLVDIKEDSPITTDGDGIVGTTTNGVDDDDNNNRDQAVRRTRSDGGALIDPPKITAVGEDDEGKVVSSQEEEEEEFFSSHEASDELSASERNNKVHFATVPSNSDDDENDNGNEVTGDKKFASESAISSSSNIRRIQKYTERSYQESYICCPFRFIRNFPKNWPRVSAIFFGMIVPLWILILVSAFFGFYLAEFEHEDELASNDYILAERAILEDISLSEAYFLRALPTYCLNDFLLQDENYYNNLVVPNTTTNNNSFVIVVDDDRDFSLNSTNSNTNQTVAPTAAAIDDDGLFLFDIDHLVSHMENCSSTNVESSHLDYMKGLTENFTSVAFESVTFNWNRCWPKELHDAQFQGWIFHPTDEIIDASRPSAQEDTYTQEWTEDQQRLLEIYLEELPSNSNDRYQAYLKSVYDATGAATCQLNVGGTAWFFFTVMTTVGYGNQAPTTSEGRILIYTAGIASLILFAVVLGTAGYICTTIFDDFVSRNKFSTFLNNPWVGVILWGTIWLVWARTVAEDAYRWWEARLGTEFDVDEKDALWFAYISTSTVGLGDYYLQPEVLFGSDALKFSVWFLIGFVFLANFFGKIVEALGSIMPKRKNSLEARLENTRILACWKRGTLLRLFNRHSSDENEEEENDEAKTIEPDVLLERVESLKRFLSKEQQEEAEEGPAIATDTAGEGGDDEVLALKLIQEEEALLQDLLSLVHEKHERLLAKTQAPKSNSESGIEEEESEMSGSEGSSFGADHKDMGPPLMEESAQFHSTKDVLTSGTGDGNSNRSINNEVHRMVSASERTADNDGNNLQINNEVDDFVAAMAFTNETTSGQQSEQEKCRIM